jgi:hypothetical protein
MLCFFAFTIALFSSGVGIMKHYCSFCHETSVNFYADSHEAHSSHVKHDCCNDHSCDSCCGHSHTDEGYSIDCEGECESERFQIAVVSVDPSKRIVVESQATDLLYAYHAFNKSVNSESDKKEFHNLYKDIPISGRDILCEISVLII